MVDAGLAKVPDPSDELTKHLLSKASSPQVRKAILEGATKIKLKRETLEAQIAKSLETLFEPLTRPSDAWDMDVIATRSASTLKLLRNFQNQLRQISIVDARELEGVKAAEKLLPVARSILARKVT